MRFVPPYVRLVLSYTAAALSAGMCASLGHVHVVLRNPETWSNTLQHRCGRVMLLCVAWAAIEMMVALVMPRERDSLMPLQASVR